jgi:hypothetical protein
MKVLGCLVTIGMKVMCVEHFGLHPLSGVALGDIGQIADATPELIFIRWDRPHWDWPGAWNNELMLSAEDTNKLSKLKFTHDLD